jgi:hypothetical protein
MSLFGKLYRLSLLYFGRTVAQGPSGSVLRDGSDQVVGGGRRLSSMLITIVNIRLHAHDVGRNRGGDLPKGKMKPTQKSRIWRF